MKYLMIIEGITVFSLNIDDLKRQDISFDRDFDGLREAEKNQHKL